MARLSTPILSTAMVLLCFLLPGCAPDSVSYDRPLVEPTEADVPDSQWKESIRRESKISRSEGLSSAADWPALFGSRRTSTTDAELNPIWPSDGPELIWEAQVGTGYGSPVTAMGRVVMNSRIDSVDDGDQECVQCRDVIDGKLIWQHCYPTTAVCDFNYSNGPYSTPIIDPEKRRVYTVGAQGQFICLDFDSGAVVWQRNLHEEYNVLADIFPVGASPILDHEVAREGGQLIFNLGAFDKDAGIISLAADGGETLWHATDHGAAYGTPFVTTIEGQRFVFVLTDLGLVSLDPDNGNVDWQFDFQRKGDLTRNATSPMVVGNHVILVGTGMGAVCLEIQPDRSYQTLWKQRRTIDSQYNTLILGDEHFYSFTSGGQGGAEFRCIDLKNGEMKWTYHSVLKRGMGLATNEAIILLGERGHLASLLLTPDAPRVLSFTEQPLMSEPCYCSPAVFEDTLILKDEKRVAAFRLAW